MHVFWSLIERSYTRAGTAGEFDWSGLDQIVGDAAQRGLRILPVVFNTPPFYKPPDVRTDVEYPPVDPGKFGYFMRQLANRYGPYGSCWCVAPQPLCTRPYLPITAWQIWNEPDQAHWWKGSRDPDPAEYLALLKEAYTNLKLADPNAEVVMAGLAPAVGTGDRRDYRTWLNAFYDLNAAPTSTPWPSTPTVRMPRPQRPSPERSARSPTPTTTRSLRSGSPSGAGPTEARFRRSP